MAAPDDVAAVTALLGRPPQADFDVVVRNAVGVPMVVRNAPFTVDGTPMPTRYWLVDPELNAAIARLEAAGGVRAAQAAIDPAVLQAAHDRHRAERDAAIDALAPGHTGPRPYGGVAGTREGVKCLHAHYAWFLAGGDDPVGRWVDEQLHPPAPAPIAREAVSRGGRSMTRVAAVDIGTNSVRLLVADGSGGTHDGGDARAAKVVPVERLMRITRLGQGVNEARALHPDAIERTLTVLREYREVIDRLGGVTSIRATATSAARDSANREEFFDAAEVALGARPELLAGEEEAALSFLGATATIDAPAPYLVVDIGGGSTEFVLGTDAPVGLVSLDMGCVRITEQFLHSDPPAPEELSNAIAMVRDLVADVPRVIPGAREAATLVGLAGTVTTVAAVELGLPEYDADKIHGFRLTRAAVEDVFRTFATETAEQRATNPGLEPGRVDVIVGGTAVLAGLLRQLEFDEVLVSESDILDGLVRSQL